VVEISPLGLVEMTRQNVTDGPREVMTKRCPTCGGDGIVISEASAAVDVERRLRALAAGSRHQAYRVEVAAKIASLLIGPGASRLTELEEETKRRFYLVSKEDVHLDHFLVLAEGKREELAPKLPVEEGAKVDVKLVEVGLHDPDAGVGKVDGLDVCVADAAKLVGKTVKAQIERVLDGTAYATLVRRTAPAEVPITAESEAEKPTRRAPTTKTEPAARPRRAPKAEPAADEPETVDEAAAEEEEGAAEPKPKKKTRRGTRGGRGRKKKTATAAPSAAAAGNGAGEPEDVAPVAARIHVPDPGLGEEEEAEVAPAEDGTEPPKPKKKTRRGTRGGRGRKKKTAAVPAAEGSQPSEADSKEEPRWEYVPMSEWGDEVD
jgi:ribonuclease G